MGVRPAGTVVEMIASNLLMGANVGAQYRTEAMRATNATYNAQVRGPVVLDCAA
jgi:hypothetical protein